MSRNAHGGPPALLPGSGAPGHPVLHEEPAAKTLQGVVLRLVFAPREVVAGFFQHHLLRDRPGQQAPGDQRTDQMVPAQGHALVAEYHLDQQVVVVGIEVMGPAWRTALAIQTAMGQRMVLAGRIHSGATL